MSDLPLRLGNYQLVRLLAQGGMADIYLARQVGLERLVAVKVLSAQRAADPESAALFMDEARLVGMLSHANLAAVHEVASEGGVHYLAMEYVHGADLRELLAAAQKSHTPIPYEAACAIILAAAAGLDHAHRRCGPDGRPLHLVHRDVSLSNIMVAHDGAVKVIDFGIARSQVSSHHTNPGIVRGKASYMSPEQCVGEDVDLRTDVFALGVVLYELTTGRRCFAGNNDFERMLAVVQGLYVPPGELFADFPVALARVIETALAPDPTKRFASCAAMIEALARACEVEGWQASAASVAQLMAQLFGTQAPIAELAEPTVVSQPVLQTRPLRRLARGTQSDLCEACERAIDEAPTRGRRSLSRFWSPLAA
ncbi:MAG: serine/threonine protein kinase [Deltaproteobacteria bacterium]|nr:serine/threonine protein kinase [Deltaproteobacteria bacterium]